MADSTTPKPFLLDYADKIVIIAVPYLVFVSCLYYYGYWGTLGFDVFSYMGVEDLIKGIAFPFKSLLFRIVLYAINIFAINYYVNIITDKIIYKIFGLVIVILISIIITYFLDGFVNDETNTSLPFSTSLILFMICIIINIIILRTYNIKTYDYIVKNNKSILSYSLKGHITELIFFAIISIASYSYFYGKLDADNIINKRNFYYIKNNMYYKNKLLTKYDSLLYLGRFGNYHFLLSPNNKQRIILTGDSLPSLILQHFNIADKIYPK